MKKRMSFKHEYCQSSGTCSCRVSVRNYTLRNPQNPLLFKKVSKKSSWGIFQKFTSLDGNQANSSHAWVCQGFPVQKPSISAPNPSKKVLGNDLFLDLLVVLWLKKKHEKHYSPKWWSPFNSDESYGRKYTRPQTNKTGWWFQPL